MAESEELGSHNDRMLVYLLICTHDFAPGHSFLEDIAATAYLTVDNIIGEASARGDRPVDQVLAQVVHDARDLANLRHSLGRRM
nr:hypothetical protein CFP56_00817 [Quercus suber]